MGNEKLCLFAVYKKPTSKLDTYDLNWILNYSINTIIASDINIKHPFWNSSRANCTGNSLELYLTSRNEPRSRLQQLQHITQTTQP